MKEYNLCMNNISITRIFFRSLARFQAVQPVSIDAIKGSINFGQEVTRASSFS